MISSTDFLELELNSVPFEKELIQPCPVDTVHVYFQLEYVATRYYRHLRRPTKVSICVGVKAR